MDGLVWLDRRGRRMRGRGPCASARFLRRLSEDAGSAGHLQLTRHESRLAGIAVLSGQRCSCLASQLYALCCRGLYTSPSIALATNVLRIAVGSNH